MNFKNLKRKTKLLNNSMKKNIYKQKFNYAKKVCQQKLNVKRIKSYNKKFIKSKKKLSKLTKNVINLNFNIKIGKHNCNKVNKRKIK